MFLELGDEDAPFLDENDTFSIKQSSKQTKTKKLS